MKLLHAFGAVLALQMVVSASAAEAQGRRNRDLITEEEIAKNAGATDTYSLIKRLRPAWFTRRGVASGQVSSDAGGGMSDASVLVVYVDGIKMGPVEEVSTVQLERVKEIRYLNANDATTKYGTGHPSGAIEITTKR